MQRQTLTDRHFRTIGYIDTATDGRQTAKDAHFRTVGYYNPGSNTTTDAHFRTIGQGNLLPSLITCR